MNFANPAAIFVSSFIIALSGALMPGPLLFVGMTVSMGRGRFSDRVYRGIVGVCAGFLFFFALSFGVFCVNKLFRLL